MASKLSCFTHLTFFSFVATPVSLVATSVLFAETPVLFAATFVSSG